VVINKLLAKVHLVKSQLLPHQTTEVVHNNNINKVVMASKPHPLNKATVSSLHLAMVNKPLLLNKATVNRLPHLNKATVNRPLHPNKAMVRDLLLQVRDPMEMVSLEQRV
jgi:hypothetical protein